MLRAAGELWEKSGLGGGAPGDSYTWGRVDVPTGQGAVLQVSAGAFIPLALLHAARFTCCTPPPVGACAGAGVLFGSHCMFHVPSPSQKEV